MELKKKCHVKPNEKEHKILILEQINGQKTIILKALVENPAGRSIPEEAQYNLRKIDA